MLQHLIIQFPPYDLSSGRLREVKNKRKCQTFSSRSGRGRLREVVAYKRFQIQRFDGETFGILENWSLRRGGRLREVVATGGSTVVHLYCTYQPACKAVGGFAWRASFACVLP